MGVGRNLRVGVGAASFIGTILACIWRLFEANRAQLQCKVQQNSCTFDAMMVIHPIVIIPLVLFLGLAIWPVIQGKVMPILFPRVDRKAGKEVWDPFGTRTGQASIDLDQELSKSYDPDRSSPGLYLQVQPTMTLSQAKGHYDQTAQQGWNPDYGYGSQPQDAYAQYANWEGGYQRTGGHGYQQHDQAYAQQAQQQAYAQQAQQQAYAQQAQQQAYAQQAQQQAYAQQAQQQAYAQQTQQQAYAQQTQQQAYAQQTQQQQQAYAQQGQQQSQAHTALTETQQQAYSQQHQAYEQQEQQQSQAHAALHETQQQAYSQQAQQHQAQTQHQVQQQAHIQQVQQQQTQSYAQNQTTQSTQSDWDGWWQGEDGQWYWWDANSQVWIPWQG